MGADVHEKHRLAGTLDHNPACGHKTELSNVAGKILAWRKARALTKRRTYLDYTTKQKGA